MQPFDRGTGSPSGVAVVPRVLHGMVLTTSCLEDELVEKPAPWRERAQYHAKRFQEKDAKVVLRRYEQKRIMSRPQLDKHAFHVIPGLWRFQTRDRAMAFPWRHCC